MELSDAYNWILACVVLVCFGSYSYMKEKKRKMDKMMMISSSSKIPKGNLGWPLVGETLDFIACGYTSKPVSFMDKRKALYGRVFKTHILGTPIIVSTDPEVNKTVLQNHGNVFVPAYPKSIRELFGEHSILQMNGNQHKRLHTIILAFLRSPSLKARITKDIEQTVKLNLSSWLEKDPVYIQQETKKVTFEILVKLVLGIGPGEELDFLKREFAEFIKGLICLPINLPGTRLHKSLKAKERLLSKVRKILEQRKQFMDKKDKENEDAMDAVDVLLRDSTKSSDNKRQPLDLVSGNIIELMLPGEETVPTAMTLAVKFLSDCPVALNKLVEENMELKRQKDESCHEYSWTDYMSLTFTQNVVSETLRMANIINGVWRKALKDVEIKGYLIPQGWGILTSFISVHLDDENYGTPYEFNPWRWEKIGASSNPTFTPFGGGQRLCPGLELSRLEIAIFLHHLVTNYRWEAKPDDIVYFPTVKMRKQLPIIVTPTSTKVGQPMTGA